MKSVGSENSLKSATTVHGKEATGFQYKPGD